MLEWTFINKFNSENVYSHNYARQLPIASDNREYSHVFLILFFMETYVVGYSLEVR